MWRVWISAPLVVAAAGGVAYLIYLQLRDAAPPVVVPGQPPAVNTLEVVKTTISVAAFIGAVLAGLYAYRKQRLTEADSLRADAVQLAQRYTTAAEQLGHVQPAVRLAGVYAMARLADDWEEQRQSCIDVLCAYLRMSARTHQQVGPDDAGELEVRDTIQRRIAEHLRPSKGAVDWTDHEFDLDNTTLHELAFDSIVCHRRMSFSGATFTGDARFDHATFCVDARFDGAKFDGEIRFDEANFLGATRFDNATLKGGARFDHARLTGDVRFDGATFGASERFDHATFGGGVRFDHVTFGGAARFDHATFGGLARFDPATFTADAGFEDATFAKDCGFEGATFQDAWFDGAKFCGDARFGNATFQNARFDDATFTRFAGFRSGAVSGSVGFIGTAFVGDAEFAGGTFVDARFGNATFARNARFDSVTFGDARFSRATFAVVPTVYGMKNTKRSELSGTPFHTWPDVRGPATLAGSPGVGAAGDSSAVDDGST